MKDLLKTALGIGITLGLSDRETFVREMSGVINKYQDDPQRGDQWAHALVSYLEQARNTMNLETAIHGALGGDKMADKETMENLTKAVKELTDQMKQSKG